MELELFIFNQIVHGVFMVSVSRLPIGSHITVPDLSNMEIWFEIFACYSCHHHYRQYFHLLCYG